MKKSNIPLAIAEILVIGGMVFALIAPLIIKTG